MGTEPGSRSSLDSSFRNLLPFVLEICLLPRIPTRFPLGCVRKVTRRARATHLRQSTSIAVYCVQPWNPLSGYTMLVAGEEPSWRGNNMMTEDDSGQEEPELEPRFEVEQTSVEKSKPGDLLDLMSRFLESPGNVLLIQGAPGTGKTTLALE